MIKKALLFILFTYTYQSLLKGQGLTFSTTQYQKKDGLPSNTVYFTTSDRSGNLWIGTDAGLCKFDGSKYTTYNTYSGLPNNEVFDIFCDSKNRIWVITMGDEVAYIEKDKVHNSKNTNFLKKIKIPDRINGIIEDEQNRIWIIAFPFFVNIVSGNDLVKKIDYNTKFGQCTQFKKLKNSILFFTYTANVLIGSNLNCTNNRKIGNSIDVNDILVDSNSLIVKKSFDNKLVRLKNFIDFSITCKSSLHTLFNFNSLIWKISGNGIEVFDKNLNLQLHIMKNKPISNLSQDIYGNIWISTLNNGLYKLNTTHARTFINNNNDFANSFYSVYVNDKIFAGNNLGNILIADRKFERLKNINLNHTDLINFRVLKIQPFNEKYLVATDKDIFQIDSKLKNIIPIGLSPSRAFKNVYVFDTLLVFLHNAGVSIRNQSNQILREYIINDRFYSATEYNNRLILGSENSIYYDHNKLHKFQANTRIHDRISDLKISDTLLVVGTADNGIFFLRNNTIVRKLIKSDGLNNNNVNKIHIYNNNFYFSTKNGICIYNYINHSTYKLMESDGLASNNVQELAIDHDTLYAATDNGLSIIPLLSLKVKEPFRFFVSPVFTESDSLWKPNQSIHTRTNKNINITMNSISLDTKGPVTYHYRIRGLDSEYHHTSDPGIYLKLQQPGDYYFEAYSTNINDEYSQMALVPIIIVPYWYQTVSFKLLCLGLFGFSVYQIYRYIIIQERKKEQEKIAITNKINRLELDAWKSNINPHFLFNSINTIQSLFSINQFEKANQFISNFSKVLRNTIDSSDKLMNTIEDEIQYLRNYLVLEKTKKGTQFSFRFICKEEELYSYYIPTLILQPILENSIKHGLKNNKDGILDVHFEKAGDHILVRVRDNGGGLKPDFQENKKSKGIKLIRDKLNIVEQITGQFISFSIHNYNIDDYGNVGTEATISLPFFQESFNEKVPPNPELIPPPGHSAT